MMVFEDMYFKFLRFEDLSLIEVHRNEYLRSLEIDELIFFKDNFIDKTLFVPNAKLLTINLIDDILKDKISESRYKKLKEIGI